MKRNIIKIGIISIIFIMIYYSGSYANQNGTTRMQVIDGATDWTNINVSQSYEECESLNSSSSTLGTTSLKAHLTTDADWSAMAIFTVSQYGGQTTNSPTWTNGNKTGIKNVGTKYIQTTGVLNTANTSAEYISGLYDNVIPKKYIKQWPTNVEQTNFVGFIDTKNWNSSRGTYGSRSTTPLSLKEGLFGYFIGSSFTDNQTAAGKGQGRNDVSFRPVIWN